MSDNESDSGYGCGCFTIVVEVVSFILICNFLGCEWAEQTTERAIGYVRTAWDAGADRGPGVSGRVRIRRTANDENH